MGTSRFLRFLAVLAVLASCSSLRDHGFESAPPAGFSSGFDAGGGGTSPRPDLAALCLELNQLRCDLMASCGLFDPADGGTARCLAVQSSTFCGPALWPARVSAGTLQVDPRRVRACSEALRSDACSSFATLPAACLRLTEGSSYLGQRCYDGYADCREGVCRASGCPRLCQFPGTEGTACDEDGDCETGQLYCRHRSSGDGSGRCERPLPLGAPCDLEARCGDALYCSSKGVCERTSKLGEPCEPGACQAGVARCALGVCTPASKDGEPCAAGADCASGLVCDATSSRCTSSTPLSLGEACAAPRLCEPGLVCFGEAGVAPGRCALPAQRGEACSRSEDCSAHLACDRLELTCRSRLLDGEPCTSSRDCGVVSTCTQGKCAPLPGTGMACPQRLCLTGLCRESLDGGVRCGPPAGPGDTCTSHEECGFGRCVFGLCSAACVP